MIRPLLSVSGLTRNFGAVTAADGVDLTVLPGEIHAVIGPNGAGKTTLIHLLAGELRPDRGRIRFMDQDITRLPVHRRAALGMARTFQVTSIFNEFSALENVALAMIATERRGWRLFSPFLKDAPLRESAAGVLARVGLTDRADVEARRLSHGEQRQVEIATALAVRPRLLLLDEPMAGMGMDASAGMVDLLRSLGGDLALLLVEHDMQAVFALADRISVLVYGRMIATGTPAEIHENPVVREAYLGDETASEWFSG